MLKGRFVPVVFPFKKQTTGTLCALEKGINTRFFKSVPVVPGVPALFGMLYPWPSGVTN
jgi:hypothetical protein